MMPPGDQGVSSDGNTSAKNMSSSDYGSAHLNISPNSTKTVTEKASLTYAAVTQSVLFPTKEQAIVMDAIDGVSIKEYTLAVAKVISPANIRFASRISNGRICMYLANQQLVDKITDTNVNINIGTHQLRIRPLISKARRIILSNVCPIIPHDLIEKKLTNMGIRCNSHLSFIRAGMNEPGFSHILSFRRQVYIEPSDIINLPDSLQIEYDNVTYWIYISTDNPKCFICKKDNHLAKQCPNVCTTSHSVLPEESPNNETVVGTLEETVAVDHTLEAAVFDVDDHRRNDKRPLSTNESSSSNTMITSSSIRYSSDDSDAKVNQEAIRKGERKNGKKKAKKIRTDSVSSDNETDIEVLTAPIKEILTQHPNIYTLSYTSLNSFLRETVGNTNHLDIAKQYTGDIKALSNMLRDIYPSLTHRSIKNRLTRIIKTLENSDTVLNTTPDLT